VVAYKYHQRSYRRGVLLFEVVTGPRERTPHSLQHREDEAFYVLKGEYKFW
jgi:mannose-6-phosphate isomerase-like protein (cupin superfamily)